MDGARESASVVCLRDRALIGAIIYAATLATVATGADSGGDLAARRRRLMPRIHKRVILTDESSVNDRSPLLAASPALAETRERASEGVVCATTTMDDGIVIGGLSSLTPLRQCFDGPTDVRLHIS